MGTLLVVLRVPACCWVTLAQPPCHWQHDTKTQNRNNVQRGVCRWQDPALAIPFLLPTAHSMDRAGVNGFMHRAGSQNDPGQSSGPRLQPGPATGSLVIRWGGGVYLERVGWRPGAQKREGLPLVPFSLVPDRVTTANGPGGAQVHDLAENHGGRHPATELCRRGIANEHNRRHTRKGKVLHVPEHATQCRVLPQSPQPRARARSWFHLS